MDDKPLVFLSYASPDYDRVHEYYISLTGEGVETWFDKERLVAGQNWDFEIKRALSRAVIIVVFLSTNSVNRRGYVQREIRIGLDQAQNKLHDDIYVIPVMLDDVPIPSQLESIQVIHASADDAKQKLTAAIETQLERLGLEESKLQGAGSLQWSIAWYKDRWEGLPGYDTSYQLPRITSKQYPQASEITDVIRGWASSEAMHQRTIKFDQTPEPYSFGQEQSFRTNSWEASCGAPTVHERVVSISYAVWIMHASAAHPNMYFKTFAFTLSPVSEITSLRQIFSDPDQALVVVQNLVRYQLINNNERFPKGDPDSPELDSEWVNRGTEDWDDFSSFTFEEDGLDFKFAPYQVAAYAFGPQFVKIEYKEVAKLMHRHFACSLGIEYMQGDYAPLMTSEQVEELLAASDSSSLVTEASEVSGEAASA